MPPAACCVSQGLRTRTAAEVGLDPSATTQRYLQRVDQHALAEFESEESEEAEYVFDEPASSDEHDTLQERHVEELLPESLSGDLPLPNVEDARGGPAPASTANRRPGAQYWSLQ